MKKIFNLVAIFAALAAAFTFASCADESKAEEDTMEQQLPQIIVEANKSYSFNNQTIGKSGYFKVISATGTAGSKVVEIEITTKKDDAKGTVYTLGDDKDHTSYLMWDGTTFSNVFQKDAVANADKIVFCLASDSDQYVITSATVNKGVNAAGATETLFGIKK